MAARQSLIGNFADESGVSSQPFAYLSVDRGQSESGKVRALIDTGAEMILLERRYALKMLGITAEDLANSDIEIKMIVPGSAAEVLVKGWRADLRLRASGDDADYLLVKDAYIYVIDTVFPAFPSLFGQKTGLQERFLAHHNRAKNGFWQLKA